MTTASARSQQPTNRLETTLLCGMLGWGCSTLITVPAAMIAGNTDVLGIGAMVCAVIAATIGCIKH